MPFCLTYICCTCIYITVDNSAGFVLLAGLIRTEEGQYDRGEKSAEAQGPEPHS
jgi:hypothetical protein